MLQPHDLFLRRTPYEIALPRELVVEPHFSAIADEVAARGIDPTDPSAFIHLGTVGVALEAIRSGEEDSTALQRFGELLFHGWHLWRSGEPTFLLSTGRARELTGPLAPTPGWAPSPPADAGYVQLPRHLFWLGTGEEGPAESIDGFFWVRSVLDTLTLLFAAGVQGNRPGFTVIALPPLPRRDLGRWADAQVREAGEDFASALPGVDVEGLLSLTSGGEAVKLAARVLRHLERVGAGEVVRPEGGGEAAGAAEASGGAEPGGAEAAGARVPPSGLAWRAIP
jgi:hypothetical protein